MTDVVELDPHDPRATVCGHCGRGWDDSVSTTWTPTPAGRCPFEYEHEYEHDSTAITTGAYPGLANMETVTFRWSTIYGKCLDCGLPAAFGIDRTPRKSWDDDVHKLCAVCAANHAVDGESVFRLDDYYNEEG
jgi:hypothetical protein